jgi:hypothetical protein
MLIFWAKHHISVETLQNRDLTRIVYLVTIGTIKYQRLIH